MTIHITKFSFGGVLRKATNLKNPFLVSQVGHVLDAETVEYALDDPAVSLGDETTLIYIENDAEEPFYIAVDDASVDLDANYNIRIPSRGAHLGVTPGTYLVGSGSKGSGP